MPATSVSHKFFEAKPRLTGKVGGGGVASAAATTVPHTFVGLTNGNAYVVTVNRTDATGTTKNPVSQTEAFKGEVSGGNFINCVRAVEGTAQAWAADTVLEILVTAYGQNQLIEGIETEHNKDGSHKKVTGMDNNTAVTQKDSAGTTRDVVKVNSNNVLEVGGKTAAQNHGILSDSGSANAYAVTCTPAPAAYETGMRIKFKATNANTGASTVNVNGLGTKTIKRYGTTDLSSGDIQANQIITVEYDGTNFLLVGSSTFGSSLLTTTQFAPQGFLINGKISATVASNNLTIAIKGMDGNDPSASNPVYCRIGDTVRTITAALSVTKNAGTNWFNAGSAELATKEIDYFVYLGYNATDGVVIGFSRIPFATKYGDFSTTTTNDKYAAISTITTAASTDYYELIGRFAATLSATASFNWSVPTFTAINLIQRPIFATRWLSLTPVYTGFSVNPSGGGMRYQIIHKTCYITRRGSTAGTSNAVEFTILAPMSSVSSPLDFTVGGMGFVQDNSATQANVGRIYIQAATSTLTIEKSYVSSNFTASGSKDIEFHNFQYEI